MEEKKTKQELLEELKVLADKHSQLKQAVEDMLDEMDKIELRYIEITEEIKK